MTTEGHADESIAHDHFDHDPDIDPSLINTELSAEFLLSEGWAMICWQTERLADIRSRAVSLFTIGSLAVALFASSYLDNGRQLNGGSLLALALYALLGILTAIAVWPTKWTWPVHPAIALEAIRAGADEVAWGILELVHDSHEASHDNQASLKSRTRIIQVIVVVLVVQILVWSAILAIN